VDETFALSLAMLLCVTNVTTLHADDLAREPEPPAVAEDVEKFLADWRERTSHIRTLRVRFSQTKKLRILRRPRTSQGTVVLDEKRFVMRVRNAEGELESVLSAAGEEFRIYYPKIRRLEIYPTTEDARARSPIILFGDDIRTLTKDYEVKLSSDGTDEVLILHPRNKKAEIAEARFRFREKELVEVYQENRRGDTTRLEIEEFTANAKISDEELEFKLPPDSEVVYPLGRPAAAKSERSAPPVDSKRE
jgi:outer membrane lipoprotein-sorting protein